MIDKIQKLVRRLYDWVLHWANTPYGVIALFLLALAESSFFPIPPDVLLIALAVSVSARAFYYAGVSSLGSIVGGLIGYGIGALAWGALGQFFFNHIPGFTPEVFEKVKALYQDYDYWIVFIAAFTPIPYKVITITAGVCNVSLIPFFIASAVGRSARFFLVASIIRYYGQITRVFGIIYVKVFRGRPGAAEDLFGKDVREFIDMYFNKLIWIFTVLLIGSFFLIKLVH